MRLIALIAITTLIVAAWASEPVPVVHLWIGSSWMAEITIDATRSYDSDGDTLYFLYDFGDGTGQGKSTATSSVHVYLDPGEYTIVVLVTDQNATTANVTASGQPASRFLMTIEILSSQDAFQFVGLPSTYSAPMTGNIYVMPSNTATMSLAIQIASSLSPSATYAATTSAFMTLGEKPALAFGNSSITQLSSAVLDATSSAWQVNITVPVYLTSVPVMISSSGVSIGGHGIAASLLELTSRKYKGTVAASVSTMSVTAAGLAILAANYTPSSVALRRDACVPATTMLLLQPSTANSTWANVNGLGGLAVFTHDLFSAGSGYSTVINLTSLCPASANCANFQVFDVALMQDHMLLLTSAGQLVSSDITTATGWLSTAVVQTGYSSIDSGAGGFNQRLHVMQDCTNHRAGTKVFLLVNQTSVIYATAPFTSWAAITVPPALIATGERIWSVVTHAYADYVTFLIAANNGTSARTVLSAPAGIFSVGYTFAAAAQITSLAYTKDLSTLFAFGSLIYQSTTSGWNFTLTYTLTTGEAVADLVSTPIAGRVGFLTSFNRVLYGQVGARGIVVVPAPLQSPPPPSAARSSLPALAFDGFGQLQLILVPVASSYPMTASAYPVGLLSSPSGVLRGMAGSAPLVTRVLLMTGSSALRPYISAAPSVVLSSRLGLYSNASFLSAGSGNSQVFSSNEEYWTVQQPVSLAEATLRSISSNQNTSVVDLRMQFALADTTNTPALSCNLTIVSASALTTGTTVTLVVNANTSSSDGWRFCDVGKSVLIPGATLAITAFMNSTAVTAQVMFVSNATKVSLQLAPSCWGVVDLRGASERACVATQQLVVGNSISNSEVIATLSGTGQFSFSSQDSYRVLSLNGGTSGVAVVNRVINSTAIALIPYSTLTAGSYSAGAWSLRLPTDQQYLETRVYRIRTPICSINSVKFNVTSAALQNDLLSVTAPQLIPSDYVDYEHSATLSVFSVPKSEGFDVVLSRSNAYNVTQTQKTYKLDTGVVARNHSVSLTDMATASQTLVGFFPRSLSVRCVNASALVFPVVSSCAPTRRLVATFGYTAQDYEEENKLDASGLSVFYNLPTNFRPPSAQGLAVATTSHIYNADATQPLYQSYFNVSRATAKFKQCAGKTHAACGCVTEQQVFMQIADSDCISKVVIWSYQDPLVPTLFFLEDEGESRYEDPYRLVELNGRTDYCVNVTGVDCTNATAVAAAILNPDNYNAIIFSGISLYHFRVQTVAATYCNLRAEFVVYVTEGPLPDRLQYLVTSLTAVGSAIMCLGGYLLYTRTHGTLGNAAE